MSGAKVFQCIQNCRVCIRLKHEIDKKTVKLKLFFTIDMHEIIDGFVRGRYFDRQISETENLNITERLKIQIQRQKD